MTSAYGESSIQNEAQQKLQNKPIDAIHQGKHLLFNPSQADDTHEAHVPHDLSTVLLGNTKLHVFLMADYLSESTEEEQEGIANLLAGDTFSQLQDFAANYDEIVHS